MLFACLLGFVFALLVRDAAAGLAGGLARGLAFAAAAVLGAFAQIAGVQGLNVLHNKILPITMFGLFYHSGQGKSIRLSIIRSSFCPPSVV